MSLYPARKYNTYLRFERALAFAVIGRRRHLLAVSLNQLELMPFIGGKIRNTKTTVYFFVADFIHVRMTILLIIQLN